MKVEEAAQRTYAWLQSLDPFQPERQELLEGGVTPSATHGLYPRDFDELIPGLIEHLRTGACHFPKDAHSFAVRCQFALINPIRTLTDEMDADMRAYWQVQRRAQAMIDVLLSDRIALDTSAADAIITPLYESWYLMGHIDLFDRVARHQVEQVMSWFGQTLGLFSKEELEAAENLRQAEGRQALSSTGSAAITLSL